MATSTRRESRGHHRESITPAVAKRLLESSLVPVTIPPVHGPGSDASSCGAPVQPRRDQAQGHGPSAPDSSTPSSASPSSSLLSLESLHPALASVKIRCHQVVETEAQPLERTHWTGPPLPCRVHHGCLWLEWRHFVDEVETFDFDPKGILLSSTLGYKPDHATGMHSPWEDYGISRFEVSDQPGAQGAWIRFQSNALPPVGQHQERTVLRWIVLDICWATSKMIQGQSGKSPPPDWSGPQNEPQMESEAASIAFRQIMKALANEHPLVFSPMDVDRFLHITRHNEIVADSICQIYERSTHPAAQRRMNQSIQRLRMQYSCVPRNDIRTLILHGLETVAYRLLNKSFKKRHASEARALNRKDDPFDSMSQEIDLPEAQEVLETDQGQEACPEGDFSDFFSFEEDNNLANLECDQALHVQREVYQGVKRSRTSSEDDNEFFEPMSME